MFVWVGISLEDTMKSETKDVIDFSNKNNILTPLENLPIHVSLRISFEIEENIFESVEKELINYFSKLKPFKICFENIEKLNNIVWLRCEKTKDLMNAHNDLCSMLKDKFNIPLHEFDNDFIYHSTLFMDDPCKIDLLFEKITQLKFTKNIISNKILIGVSENGNANTYKIYKTIEI